MKKIIRNPFLLTFLILMVMTVELFFLMGCKKKEDPVPVITTTAATQISSSSAFVGGEINNPTPYKLGFTIKFGTTPTANLLYNIDATTVKRARSNSIFTVSLTGLLENTTYYYYPSYSYFTYSKTSFFGGAWTYVGSGPIASFTTDNFNKTILFNVAKKYGTVTDIDGNIYKTIQIGTQVWMAENLRVTRYRDGSQVPLKIYNNATGYILEKGYYNYGNDAAYETAFGHLYSYDVVNDNHNLCPTGWHVPSLAEWRILESYLGNSFVAGAKLKEVGTNHWDSSNYGANNESGFTALPSGSINIFSREDFSCYAGNTAIWWESTGKSYSLNNNNYITVSSDGIDQTKSNCFSVRCVKDN